MRFCKKLENIDCPNCNKTFKPKTHKTRFCSQRCQWDSKKLPALLEPVLSKKCSHCKIEKSAENFCRSYGARTGLQSWCSECSRERKRPKEMIEYDCEDCGQLCKRVASSAYKKVTERKNICYRCSRRRTIEANGGRTFNYTGTEFFPGKTICSWKHSAKRRNHEWQLSNEELDLQYIKQNKICALSGIQMGGSSSSPYRPSIDRIDSTKGYIQGNFQFVCSIVNVMKNKLPEDLFIDLCGKIANHKSITSLPRTLILEEI